MRSSYNVIVSSNNPQVKAWAPLDLNQLVQGDFQAALEDLDASPKSPRPVVQPVSTTSSTTQGEVVEDNEAGQPGTAQAQKPSKPLPFSFFMPRVLKSKQADQFVQDWMVGEFTHQDILVSEHGGFAGVSLEQSHLQEEFNERLQTLEQEKSEIDQLYAAAQNALQIAQRQAEQLMEQARRQSSEMVALATAEANQVREDAYEEGMTAAKNEAVNILRAAQSVVTGVQSFREQVFSQNEQALINMVVSMGQKLFGKGFELEPTILQQVVLRAVSEASRLGNLRVYLHPADEASLVSLWQESDLTLNGQKIQLVPSQDILRGGCFVEGEFGSVDARIDNQLNMIEGTFKETEYSPEPEESESAEGELPISPDLGVEE
jgi:flagellar biosynthesis/type III secretory pathway protein FliH